MKRFTLLALFVAAAMLLAGCHSTGPVAHGPEDQAVITPVAPAGEPTPPPPASYTLPEPTAATQPPAPARDPYALDNFFTPEEKVQLTTGISDATRAQIIANAKERQNEALEIKRGLDREWERNKTAAQSLQNWSISHPPAGAQQ